MVAPESFKDIVTEAPTAEEIARVRQNAVSFGGAVMALPHKDRSVVYRDSTALKVPHRQELVGCGEVAQFTAPLDDIEPWQEEMAAERNPDKERRPTDAQGRADGTRMCVVDDAAHLWPRFQ